MLCWLLFAMGLHYRLASSEWLENECYVSFHIISGLKMSLLFICNCGGTPICFDFNCCRAVNMCARESLATDFWCFGWYFHYWGLKEKYCVSYLLCIIHINITPKNWRTGTYIIGILNYLKCCNSLMESSVLPSLFVQEE